MCGRYTLSTPGDEIAELFDLAAVPALAPRFNIAPTQEAAVVLKRSPTAPRTLEMLRWGLVPHWADDPSIGNRMINARAETAAEKPSFKLSLRKRRCLVAVDGFYEWKKVGAGKQPYWIHLQGGGPFAFAGLWASWKPRGSGEEVVPLETFTLLTTSPNAEMRELHDRMPVILAAPAFERWLDPAFDDLAALAPLLAALPDGSLSARPVSRRVNNPANDSPDCLAVAEG